MSLSTIQKRSSLAHLVHSKQTIFGFCLGLLLVAGLFVPGAAQGQQGLRATADAESSGPDAEVVVAQLVDENGHVSIEAFKEAVNEHGPDLLRRFQVSKVAENTLRVTPGPGFKARKGNQQNRAKQSAVAQKVKKASSTAWEALSGETNGVLGTAFKTAEYQGDLVVGGFFNQAGDGTQGSLLRWDGSSWQSLGYPGNDVRALTVGPNGALYAAGFRTVYRLDSGGWTPIGSNLDNTVWALTVDESGTLYAGGSFEEAGFFGPTLNGVARYNASSGRWEPVGSGFAGFAPGDENDFFRIRDLTLTEEGTLVAGGFFFSRGDGTRDLNFVARFDEQAGRWNPVGSGFNSSVLTLDSRDDVLFAGGYFTERADRKELGSVAKINLRSEEDWQSLGSGLDGSVWSLDANNDGPLRLFAGGFFEKGGGTALFQYGGWEAISGGVDDVAYTITLTDDRLYAGGFFTERADGRGRALNGVAQLSSLSSGWGPVGGVQRPTAINGAVWATAQFDGGLIIGGDFTRIGEQEFNHVAWWDGSQWRAFGQGLNGPVFELVKKDQALFAGGRFTARGNGGGSFNRVAQFRGGQWKSFADETPDQFQFSEEVRALTIGPDGGVLMGGCCVERQNQDVNIVARWDGFQWSQVGSAFRINSFGTDIYDLFYQEGQDRLFVGGEFQERIDGQRRNGIALLESGDWEPYADENAIPIDFLIRDMVGDAAGTLIAAGELTGTIASGVVINGAWFALGGQGPEAYSLDRIGGSIYMGGDFGFRELVGGWQVPIGGDVSGGAVFDLTVTQRGLLVGGSFANAAGTYTPNLARYTATPAVPPTALSRAVDARSSQTVAFEGTGLSLAFSEASKGVGMMSVYEYDEAPGRSAGLGNAEVLGYHLELSAESDLSVGAGTELRIQADQFESVDDVTAVQAYRWNADASTYEEVSTRYDAEKNALVAEVTSLGQFAFAVKAEALPVEMSAFDATLSGTESVQLSWATASETNNAGFRVQRQTEDGNWRKIGFVESAVESGTTTESQQYAFTDGSLPYAADTLSYRLEQVDMDGTTSYSSVVTVGFEAPTELRLGAPSPNPARGQVTVQYAVPEESAGQPRLKVYDVLGRTVESATKRLERGRGTLRLETSSFSSGVYFLRLTGEGQSKTQRFTVVK